MVTRAADLSVIIVSYNTSALLAACLHSVFAAESVGGLEVLVVDNASSDQSVAMVTHDFPAAHLICNEHNRGFAAANNQALSLARGRHILFLNSDAAVLPDAFERLRDAFAAHSTMGLAGLRLRNPDGSPQPSWGAFPTPASELLFQSFLFKVWPARFPYGRRIHPWQWLAYQRFQWVDWVTGAAFAIRREVYDRIGGLPEEGGMYGEDLEYCWRAQAAGLRVAYCPGAQAYHQLQGSAGGDYARWIESYTRATLAFYRRHCSFSDLRWAARYIRMGSIVRQYLWRVVSRVFPKRSTEAKSRIVGYRQAAALASDALRGLGGGPITSS